MIWKEIDFQGQVIRVRAQQINGVLWFHWQGQTWSFQPPKPKARGAVGAGVQTGLVKAPMPGKIVSILRHQGSSVVVGDIILVMEAMKMEYSLKSDANGVLQELRVSEGQQVGLGDLLARIQGQEPGRDEK